MHKGNYNSAKKLTLASRVGCRFGAVQWLVGMMRGTEREKL